MSRLLGGGLRALAARPAGLSRASSLEWEFSRVRWIGILIVAPSLVWLPLLPRQRLGAYLVLALAAGYNALLQRAIRRRLAALENGVLTLAADSLLTVIMLALTGAQHSPVSYVVYLVTLSAVMRYGLLPACGVALGFVVLDALDHLIQGVALTGAFAFRSGTLLLCAALAGHLRTQTFRDQAELAGRLAEASLLNQSAEALAGTLDLSRVLHGVAAAFAQMCPRACVFLFPSPRVAAGGGPEVIHMPALGCDAACRASCLAATDELRALAKAAGPPPPTPWRTVLPSRRPAVVFAVRGATEPTVLATIGVVPVLSTGRARAGDPPAMLVSLAEQAGLAIENALLYHDLAQRGDALQAAYAERADAHRQLLQVDDLKSSFLANVSHEFRTPLTSIRSFAELLGSYRDADVHHEFLDIINRESERLARMLDDVLDITRIESGAMDWRPQTVDLPGLVGETARAYSPIVAQAGLDFVQHVPTELPPVTADRDRLQQVLRNLLDNAVKCTPSGSITVSARSLGNAVEVAVSDTGVGIPLRHHQTIFAKFHQLGERPLGKGHGAGLGLSICREIVEHHGGRIWVESTPGSGSTFKFTLPIRPPSSLTAGRLPESTVRRRLYQPANETASEFST